MYKVIGIMSGTSMDGLDLCMVHFQKSGNQWTYSIKKSTTLAYSSKWLEKLNIAPFLPAKELHVLHMNFGKYIGKCVNTFKKNLETELICSHGHTVFHEAAKGITFQLGHPQAIATECGIKTVGDFRTLDVLLGGQGAPLVPIGDKLLFDNYQACINLGGFSNISFDRNNQRLAFDICPVNIVLNHLCKKIDLEYDRDGELARSGNLNLSLLEELNSNNFYAENSPKSLSREWVEENVYKLWEKYPDSIENHLRSYAEHIAQQIAGTLVQNSIEGEVLFSGGGAKNLFLMQRIKELSSCKIIVADEELLDYKEALIFALLGILRIEKKINVLKSVTGASKNSSSGVVFLPQ